MSLLKQRKEDFVSNLNGGTLTEVNYVTSVAVVSYFCWNIFNSASGDEGVNIWVDFILNWVALLASMTLYAKQTGLLMSLMLIPCVIVYFCSKAFTSKPHPIKPVKKGPTKEKIQFKLIKKPYITAYRSHMLIVTCLAILAVDFRVFPRRFAKVETWGTSLMDLGVGSFVFSNGIVAARPLLKSIKKPSFFKRILGAVRSCHTLLILGLLRLYFVKNLEYQEHVTEYGVHWNFFITLSLLPIVLVFIDPIAEYIPRFLIALSISSIYEWFLIKDDVFLTYLILADRTGIVSANREGLVSFLGYCAIFLWGQSVGLFVLGNTPTKNNFYKRSVTPLESFKKYSTWERITTVTPLKGLSISFVCMLALTKGVFETDPRTVSRRFANLPYTLWVVTFNIGFLMCYCLIDMVFKISLTEPKTSVILESMNSNGLILFLLANISTGVVNMSMSTIDASTVNSLLVLLGYSGFIALVSVVLYKMKIFVRL
ncbi:glucosaminyl-phosphotidylinositol O-acyltransferase KNAG_0B01820 [Huiozyma naganishii CBS 8797]|uniref:GPI-anchored wall transfer protein n=1 Tax=Huiozyma naganishii (strain ATCC MYA-139 / BCRC 22969 / CBS 8797 / KCTC 17520 / NBRC 10181 / NCYC 3082 / Yp74L-3) TaxID=1071383 RepID=J7R1E1_HUIN7|nr:hypothetical protein KNAG_0B01820 [Kazachstania naganishii CBS 8797]CCK68625.1 hypothetical protein KNAG_0B01820 [Kazachstania naganishii CBS 8797]